MLGEPLLFLEPVVDRIVGRPVGLGQTAQAAHDAAPQLLAQPRQAQREQAGHGGLVGPRMRSRRRDRQPSGLTASLHHPQRRQRRRRPPPPHAHRVGLGNAAYFFIRGTGRVSAVERSRVLIEVDGAIVALRTGPVFGNVVRDGSGRIEVNDVPGLTEFNALSAELNRLVEERVQPALKSVAVGATIRFAGCAEAPESLPASGPLFTLVPVQAEVLP